MEGDIFKGCIFKIILDWINPLVVGQLEQRPLFSVSTNELTEAVRVVADVGGTGIGLDWVIKKIHKGKELLLQYQKVTGLKMTVKEIELFLHQSKISRSKQRRNCLRFRRISPMWPPRQRFYEPVSLVPKLARVLTAFPGFDLYFVIIFLSNEWVFEPWVVITCTHICSE